MAENQIGKHANWRRDLKTASWVRYLIFKGDIYTTKYQHNKKKSHSLTPILGIVAEHICIVDMKQVGG
jgi:hypothetical protein